MRNQSTSDCGTEMPRSDRRPSAQDRSPHSSAPASSPRAAEDHPPLEAEMAAQRLRCPRRGGASCCRRAAERVERRRPRVVEDDDAIARRIEETRCSGVAPAPGPPWRNSTAGPADCRIFPNKASAGHRPPACPSHKARWVETGRAGSFNLQGQSPRAIADGMVGGGRNSQSKGRPGERNPQQLRLSAAARLRPPRRSRPRVKAWR